MACRHPVPDSPLTVERLTRRIVAMSALCSRRIPPAISYRPPQRCCLCTVATWPCGQSTVHVTTAVMLNGTVAVGVRWGREQGLLANDDDDPDTCSCGLVTPAVTDCQAAHAGCSFGWSRSHRHWSNRQDVFLPVPDPIEQLSSFAFIVACACGCMRSWHEWSLQTVWPCPHSPEPIVAMSPAA